MIPIARPFMDEREASAASRVILSGWVTQGPEVAAFETEFAEYTGANHAVAVSNCTTGLHLSLLAAGVGQGDEVITVSHSFVATANAIRHCGAVPVFVDIDPITFNLDPSRIEAAITEKTKAVLLVHQIGMPADLSKIVPLARKHDLKVIEDAACAAGSEILWDGEWEKIGRVRGDAAVFSFHPRKIISTGDGGMITTPHAEWNEKFRLLRQHAMSVPDTVRHSSNAIIFEEYPEVGYNYRMTDIQAAVGREQLKRLPDIVSRRRTLAKMYFDAFAQAQWIELPGEPVWARSNWQSFSVGLPEWCDQKTVMQKMLDSGVATRRGIMCSHREAPYRGTERFDLTQSETAQDNRLLLPLFPQMEESDLQQVASSLITATSR